MRAFYGYSAWRNSAEGRRFEHDEANEAKLKRAIAEAKARQAAGFGRSRSLPERALEELMREREQSHRCECGYIGRPIERADGGFCYACGREVSR